LTCVLVVLGGFSCHRIAARAKPRRSAACSMSAASASAASGGGTPAGKGSHALVDDVFGSAEKPAGARRRRWTLDDAVSKNHQGPFQDVQRRHVRRGEGRRLHPSRTPRSRRGGVDGQQEGAAHGQWLLQGLEGRVGRCRAARVLPGGRAAGGGRVMGKRSGLRSATRMASAVPIPDFACESSLIRNRQ